MQKQAETEKFILKAIPRSLRSRIFRGYELYNDFNLSKIKFPEKRKASRSKKALCAKILNSCFDLIIQDIIDNNIIFNLPVSKKTPALISISPVSGDEFKAKYVAGCYPGLDFLKTNFTAPEITYTYWDKRGKQDRGVWLSDMDTRTELNIKYSNGYHSNTVKEMDDYLESLQELYPYMLMSDLKFILKLGFNFIRKIITIWGIVSVGNKKTRATISKRFKRWNLYSNECAQASRKARIKWHRGKKTYDDYYYFALGNKQFNTIKEDVEKHRKITFKNLYLYKSAEECWLRRSLKSHFFKVSYPLDCGFFMYKDELKTKNYEYLGNEREKSRNKWVQQGSKSRSKPNITAKQLVKLLS